MLPCICCLVAPAAAATVAATSLISLTRCFPTPLLTCLLLSTVQALRGLPVLLVLRASTDTARKEARVGRSWGGVQGFDTQPTAAARHLTAQTQFYTTCMKPVATTVCRLAWHSGRPGQPGLCWPSRRKRADGSGESMHAGCRVMHLVTFSALEHARSSLMVLLSN